MLVLILIKRSLKCKIAISNHYCGGQNIWKPNRVKHGKEKVVYSFYSQENGVSLVKGAYPQYLINLWENFDEEKGSENDHPKIFKEQQLFVLLELKFAGEDLSTFRFTNAEQAYYAFLQIMTTLAVGEVEYKFEHRDLHWGNILIKAESIKKIPFKLNGKILTIPSKGIRTTIIDYTLSRITFDQFCYYNDLSSDEELFEATGDDQYEIYRKMRQELK
ncbi:uncharacterized protein Dwil_GK23382 [Drosophila willistoni]|uniref:Non-specific serine/threonine protein kinase n=1 Tax=Drosophila willistoni TaxID=7260 RepID=B4NP01_DROWI|nr:uncharacterized protein Dwil_GK23382 [Drosophila willistoni]